DRAITDGNCMYHFDNVATDAFYSVTPALASFSFSPASRSFSLIGNKTDAVFTATTASNPFENPLNGGDFFVRQQYLDFLGREPDHAGWLFWTDQIARCLSEPPAVAGGLTAEDCIRQRLIDVSASFFMSEEFQQSGSYIYRLYRA